VMRVYATFRIFTQVFFAKETTVRFHFWRKLFKLFLDRLFYRGTPVSSDSPANGANPNYLWSLFYTNAS